MALAPEVIITHDADALADRFSNIANRAAPYAIARALTFTARDVLIENRRNMERVFDRPTRFTLNAFETVAATKNEPMAIVRFKLFAGKGTSSGLGAEEYLGPQEFGGARRPKRFERRLRSKGIMRANEFAVPARGVRLDRFGNIPGSRITQILSQLKAFNTAGFNANMTEKGLRKRIEQGKTLYFAVKSGAKTHLPGGVYERRGKPTGKRKFARGLKAVLIFVRQPYYRKRLGFYDTARRVTEDRLPRQMRLAFSDMIERFSKNERF